MVQYGLHKNKIFTGTGPRQRVGFLDEMRGLCIILMVLYHAAYDVIYIFGWDITLQSGTRLIYWLFHSPVLRFLQPFVAGIFIFISGIACRYSRSNLKRGAIALGLGIAMSIVTLLLMPGQAIYFGILHFLGVGMILFALLQSLLDKLSPALGLIICAVLFLFTYGIGMGYGYVGIPGLWEVATPASWAQNRFLIPLGFAKAGADFFPLLPWLFLFFAGSYMGIPFAMREMPDGFYRSRFRFLAAIGRHTIYVYVLHQPVVYGLLWGIDKLVQLIRG